jgi:hypothetical protein
MLKAFAAVCALSVTSACVGTMTPGSATEAALCETWGKSLPTRSRQDTGQTSEEIQAGYADFSAACPAFADLIPN